MITWNLETRKLDSLTRYEKNPRTLSEKEHRQLSNSIDKFGLIDKPILNANNTIIGGHQRIEVLSSQNVQEVQCWIPGRLLSDEEVEELNIRLNRNNGSWDIDILANEYDIGDLLTWGFDEVDLGIAKPEKEKKPEKAIITLEFENKDTMIEYIQKCEIIAEESNAKLKVKG